MDLKNRIENNLVLWLLGSLATGFMAGLATYQGILEVAQLEVVAKTKLEDLEREASLARATSASSHDTRSELTTPPTASPEGSKQSVKVAPKFELSASPPFPKGLDSVRPGMQLSTARSVFPDGEMTPNWYSSPIEAGPFRHVAFFVYGFDNDPIVDVVNLQFRSADSRRTTIEVLLRELGDRRHRTEMLGERIVWPDVNGYQLSVDQSYTIPRGASEDAGDT